MPPLILGMRSAAHLLPGSIARAIRFLSLVTEASKANRVDTGATEEELEMVKKGMKAVTINTNLSHSGVHGQVKLHPVQEAVMVDSGTLPRMCLPVNLLVTAVGQPLEESPSADLFTVKLQDLMLSPDKEEAERRHLSERSLVNAETAGLASRALASIRYTVPHDVFYCSSDILRHDDLFVDVPAMQVPLNPRVLLASACV